MHRVLQTPELVLEIVSHLYTSGSLPKPEERSCLLALALTSTRFTEIALNALWHYMDNLTPLFKLLNNFESLPDSPGVIKGEISEADLMRFKEYSSRIQTYCPKHSMHTSDEVVSTSAYLRILRLQIHTKTQLLPPSRRLEVGLPSNREELPFLLHAGLSELEIDSNPFFSSNTSTPVTPAVFFEALSDACPRLKRLCILSDEDLKNAINHISRMRRLEELEISSFLSDTTPFPCDFFSTLQSSSTLTTFTTQMQLLPSTCHRPFVTLPSLTRLTLQMELIDLRFMKDNILGSNSFPALDCLVLELDMVDHSAPPAMREWSDFCKTVGTLAPRLTQLKLDAAYDSIPLDLPFQPVMGMFSSQLTVLEIKGQILKPIQEADVLSLSRSAPLLGSLRYSSRSSVEILVNIARNLTSLTNLVIALGTMEFPPITMLPLPVNKIIKLTIIEAKPPQDPILAASCLHRLFPELTDFRRPHVHNSQTEISSVWDTVERVLGALWRAREDDGARAHQTLDGLVA